MDIISLHCFRSRNIFRLQTSIVLVPEVVGRVCSISPWAEPSQILNPHISYRLQLQPSSCSAKTASDFVRGLDASIP